MLIKLSSILLCSSLFSSVGITQAGTYRANSHYQWQTAVDSLNDFSFESGDLVLDVGCGDGKITALVSERVPEGLVVGVDVSEEMIGEAASRFSRNNLTFVLANASEIPYKDRFNEVISFNAMHWVLEQKKALQSIFDSLKGGGRILLQFPAYRPNNLGTVSEKMARSEKWLPFFPHYQPVRVYYTPEQYTRLLEEVGFQVQLVESVENASHFPDRSAFVAWMTPLINFIDQLPPERQKEFLEELCDEMLLIDPLNEDGSVSIHLVQLRAITKKSTETEFVNCR